MDTPKDAYLIPMRVWLDGDVQPYSLFDEPGQRGSRANLSAIAREYLNALGFERPDEDAEIGGLIWFHAIAIGHSARYLAENDRGVRKGWPRIPLPRDRDRLKQSASLGRRIADLADPFQSVEGVTAGMLDPFLQTVAVISATGGSNLRSDQLAVTANWGYVAGRSVQSGSGKWVRRAYDAVEADALSKSAEVAAIDGNVALDLLGHDTVNVYLNKDAYWRNVPISVYRYVLGGYPVLRKWLSYREKSVLGRGLTVDEARTFTNNARRIVTMLLMQPDLDSNYIASRRSAWAAPTRA